MSDYEEKEDGPSSVESIHENKDNRSDAVEDISFESMIECCSSITQTAINCPSFQQHFASLHSPADSSIMNNHNESYQEEVELSKWLDCQISDLQTAIHSISDPQILNHQHHHRSEDDPHTKKSDWKKKEHETRKLRQDLLLETVQEQQQRLYLSRLRMSLAASYTKLSPDTKGNSNDAGGGDCDEEIDKYQQLLVREALKSRDKAVLSALEKTKKIDQYQRELDELTKKHASLKRKNQNMWAQLLSNELRAKGTNETQPQSSSHYNYNNTIQQQLPNDQNYLRKETNLLKHAMIDMIINSGLDWHSDPRLNNIMMTLDE